MTKKDKRDSVARCILRIELGMYRDKTTRETVTLKNISEEILTKMNTVLAENKISRKSIYCAIEMMAFSVFPEDARTDHLQNIHEFCYTQLTK